MLATGAVRAAKPRWPNGLSAHATAALVFAQAMPGCAEPGPEESRSYMKWLRQRPRAERYVDA